MGFDPLCSYRACVAREIRSYLKHFRTSRVTA
jgi:hypothetical protein